MLNLRCNCVSLFVRMSALVFAGCAGSAMAQTAPQTAIPSPGMIGTDAPKGGGYSNWDVQLLYGNGFREPGNPNDVAKTTFTIENASAWSWGSSYFFIDVLHSDSSDQNAWEGYGEWYPSASLGKMTGKDLSLGILKDVSLTTGINAGRKSTGANPLVFLPVRHSISPCRALRSSRWACTPTLIAGISTMEPTTVAMRPESR